MIQSLIIAVLLSQAQPYVLTTNINGGVSVVPAVTDGGYASFSYVQGSGLTDGGSWPVSILGTVPVSLASAPTTAVTGTFFQTTQPVSIATAPVLVAGSALIGKVGIDQTTVGTTNAVSLAQLGANAIATGSGASNTGTIRVMLSSDSVVSSISQIAAVAPVMTAASAAAVAANRALVVAVSPNGGNPCQNPSATVLGVAGATSGTAAVQLVALSGTTKIYVCSVTVTGVSGTTPTFALQYGTGTACAVGTVTAIGPLTTTTLISYNFNSPIVTSAGAELCYIQTGSSPINNYSITYAQQ